MDSPASTPKPPRRKIPIRTGVAGPAKIVISGLLLAAAVFVAFFNQPTGNTGLNGIPPKRPDAKLKTPELDPQVLALAKDKTHTDRMRLEAEPISHLLEKSLNVVPSIARALGMPDQPVPIERLRHDPNSYRGSYLWYKGELKFVTSDGREGHPVRGFKIYEGWIETDSGDTVMFRVSVRPKGIKVGDIVRVQGFFMKLRDSKVQPNVEMAPILIGPELYADYADWDAVDNLDKTVLARIEQGSWARGEEEPTDLGHLERSLAESQGVPLWHLASYARHQAEKSPPIDWHEIPALVKKDSVLEMRYGETPAGSPTRILGTFVQARTYEADPNPLGIQHWTEVWVLIRDIGAMHVPIWIPEKLEGTWNFNEPIDTGAFFYRGMLYMTQTNDERFTPIFVASKLKRFVPAVENPVNRIVKWSFFGLSILVIGFFVLLNRRDKKTSAAHAEALIERRRKRRAHTQPS